MPPLEPVRQDVSVVIPTYNRRTGLSRTLQGLAAQAQDRIAFEAVVVDDGSSDGTPRWVDGQRFPFPVRLLTQANAGPAAARNAGLRAASGKLILFVDDDTEPMPGLLREHIATHGASDDRVVMGPLGSADRYPDPWVAWEQVQLEKQYRAMSEGLWSPTFRQFWTGNASVQRSRLLEAGGFDVSYRRGEDVELGMRLHARGLSFHFNPRAVVIHHARRSLDSWCSMYRQYGALETRMYADAEDVLRGNWERLHPAVRAIVSACAGRPVAPAAIGSLRALLAICGRLRATRAAQAPCSVLANLLFWDAVSREGGREAFLRLSSSD